jgi:phosphoribosylformylglycinamidine synthase
VIAKVYITPKEGVLDPQGKAVLGVLKSLGFMDIDDVKVGKYIVVKFAHTDKEKANADTKAMCDKLLANNLIESYEYKIEE